MSLLINSLKFPALTFEYTCDGPKRFRFEKDIPRTIDRLLIIHLIRVKDLEKSKVLTVTVI